MEKLPRSQMTPEYLPTLVKDGLVSLVNCARVPGAERVANPELGEVFVFEEELVCGLRFPYCDFMEAVMRHFELEV